MLTGIAIAVVALVIIGVIYYFWRRAEVVPPNEASRILDGLRDGVDQSVSPPPPAVQQIQKHSPTPLPPSPLPASRPSSEPEENYGPEPQESIWFVIMKMIIAASTIGALYIIYKLTGVDGLLVIGEIILFLIVMSLMSGIMAWRTGYLNTLFFEIEDGNVAFVDSGQSNVFVYMNDPGYILEWGAEVDGVRINDWVRVTERYPGQSEKNKTFIQKTFGKYWVGFKFMNRKVHMIPLTKKRAATNIRPNMPPEEWITGTDDVVMVDQLRTVFPRPVAVPDLKFVDGFEAHLLLNGNYEVVVPRRLVYRLKGDFFGLLESYTRTGMNDVATAMTSTTFKASLRAEGSQMSSDIVAAINKTLIEVCGVKSKGFSIPIYNLSTDREEAAAKAAEIERLEGLGRIAKATADAEISRVAAERAAANKIIDARAEAEADNLRNAASITDITIATKELVGMGVDPNVAAMQATIVGKATRHTDPNSRVTTLVEGGNVPIAINPKPSN